jgi:hypothetical protein
MVGIDSTQQYPQRMRCTVLTRKVVAINDLRTSHRSEQRNTIVDAGFDWISKRVWTMRCINPASPLSKALVNWLLDFDM